MTAQNLNITSLDRSDLQGEWLLDGDAIDTSGNGYDGTSSNVTWTTSEIGYVSEEGNFNGSTSKITKTNETIFQSTTKTVTAWIKTSTTGTTQVIINKTNPGTSFEWFFRVETSNKVTMRQNSDAGGTVNVAVTSNATVTDGNWHFVCGVINDNTNAKVYIDGVLDNSSTSVTGTANHGTDPIGIGGRQNTTQLFNGDIGLVRYYNVELTQERINNLYLEGLRRLGPKNLPFSNIDRTNLVASYEGENSGATWYDSSGNGNNGTATSVDAIKVGQVVIGDYNGSTSYNNIDTVVGDLATSTTGYWSGWIYMPDATPSTSGVIISTGDTNGNYRIIFYINTSGNLRGLATNNGTTDWLVDTDSTPFTDNTWYFVELVQDGVSPELFVDRVSTAQTFISSINKTRWFNDFSLLDNGRIGCQNFNSSGNINFFPGKIGLPRLEIIIPSNTERDRRYKEGLTRLNFPKYSLPNLENGKVLEISRAAVSGTYYDQTGNGNNWTEQGTVTDTTLGLNNEMSGFSASNYLNASDATVYNSTTKTLKAWIKTSTTGTAQQIINKTTGSAFEWWMRIDTGNTIRLQQSSEIGGTAHITLNSVSTVTDGKWYRIIGIIKDGSFGKIYINGVLDNSTTTVNSTAIHSTTGLGIGARNNGLQPFGGSIAQVEYLDGEMTEEEIQQDFYSNFIES